MMIEPASLPSSRRKFLQGIFPAGALLCSGCGLLSASSRLQDSPQNKIDQHKILKDSGLTMREAFRFAFQYSYIPTMQALAARIGREKLVEMIAEATRTYWAQQTRRYVERLPKKDFRSFLNMDTFETTIEDAERRRRFWSLAITTHRIESTPKSHEIDVTECLWAQAFREAHEEDIGFATICYGDEVMAAAFDQRLKFLRTKALMKGDDCCHFRWVWEG